MKILEGRGKSVFLPIPWLLLLLTVGEISAIRLDMYLNKDKFGEYLRMDISEKGCTNVPLNWDNQAISLDTHGSCVKLYDLPYCRGKYVALQPYHGTFQDNLETLGFKQLVSSASPCGPKVPTGRYYILNGADGSVLTIDKKNGTVVAKTLPFKPYITKNQQFQIDKISLADYEFIPRVHDDLNPLTFDMSLSTKSYPVRRTWKIESVYRGKYLIKNEWNNRCLYKTEKGKVDEHECVPWSPNQEWMFKSIKVQPFFPTKQELTGKPIRPEEKFPFDAQQEVPIVYPHGHPHPPRPEPNQPLYIPKDPKRKPLKTREEEEKDEEEREKEKEERDEDEDEEEEEEDDDSSSKIPPRQVPHTRPNPIVLNHREPFPPVQPQPIYPKGTQFLPPIGPDGKPDFSKPPVPQVLHPGRLPFPREPVVTNPKKPIWPPTLFGSFGPTPPPTPTPKPTKKKNSEEEDEEEENDKEEVEDEKEDADDEKEGDDGEKEEADDPDEEEASQQQQDQEREDASSEKDEEN